ncbi:MAG TPA: DegT/DnrJ/EryC1/StrS family aminotransferase [Methylomirabilota bacterium]|nr:DegT/DnrJ/EryC1/StrS family aminotransferase [Methylomirabilota bacterium]
MNIPFLNLKAQYEELKGELLPAVELVLAGGHYILGPGLAAFEQELASYVGSRFGIGVNSGSDALTLALRALEIGPGDEVITTPFTYIAPAESIHQMGAKIVFADIDPRTFNIDPADARRRITPRTRAIIPVHLFGQAASMDDILALAGEHGLHVVEDCAQAIGARYRDQPLGSLGRLGCFSFYPTKNLGADGDGGMVVTNDEGLAKRVRMLRVHGIERRYHHDLHGYNSRLDEVQAAILRVKLKRLEGWNHRRREIAARYDAGLDLPGLERPLTAEANTHVFHVYAVLTDRRDELQRHLTDRGVPTIIYYPQPLHLQKVYADLGFQAGDFPAAESVSSRILPLPMYPELTDAQVDYVIGCARSFFG